MKELKYWAQVVGALVMIGAVGWLVLYMLGQANAAAGGGAP